MPSLIICYLLAASIIADTAGKTKTKGDKTKGKGKGAATQETEVSLMSAVMEHIISEIFSRTQYE